MGHTEINAWGNHVRLQLFGGGAVVDEPRILMPLGMGSVNCNMKAKVIMEYLETLKEIRDTVKGDKALAISFGINELGIADMFCDIARHDFWGEPVPDRLE